MKGKEILIVGGGRVALRKLEKLLPYGGRITVAAPQIDPALYSAGAAAYLPESFHPDMLQGKHIVIAATNNRKINQEISFLCQKKHIPVNVVDDRELCSFLFPSLVKKGDLSIGISTGGASPTTAIWCREQIEAILPDSLSQILSYLESLRPIIMENIGEESVRAQIYKSLFRRCIAEDRVLSEEELRILMEEYHND